MRARSDLWLRKALAACRVAGALALLAAAAPRLRAEDPPAVRISLNDATAEELLAVPGVDERMAEKIIYMRDQLGGFQSVTQLMSIPGMTPELFSAVRDYVDVPPAEEPGAEEGLPDALGAAEAIDEQDGGDEGSAAESQHVGEENLAAELANQPIDINRAKEEDLRDLPGVDRLVARHIVRERALRKRFSSVDELAEVDGVTPESLERMRPYVMVKTAKEREAFFAGDTRMRMRNVNPRGTTLIGASPRFQNNTYIYNRTRLRFGEQSQVGWLAKRASVGAPLTPEAVQRLDTLKFSVQETDVGFLDRLIVGNYTISHGQGLVFYDGLGEYVRPAKIKSRGPKPDFTSGSNEYHKGAIANMRLGDFDAEVFVSQKELDFKVSTTGVVDADMNDLRAILGDLQDEEAIANNDTVTERLHGGRLSYTFADRTNIGVMGYESTYDHVFNKTDATFSNAHIFRGDKNVIGSVDFDSYYRSLNLFGEVAKSRATGPGLPARGGTAWTATTLYRITPVSLWATYFDYDQDFFTRHGKGPSFAIVGEPEDLTVNQRGVKLGLEYEGRRYTTRINYDMARFPSSLGDGTNASPIQASEGRQLYWENVYKISRGVDLYFRYQRSDQDGYFPVVIPSGNTNTTLQYSRYTEKYRYQVTWSASQAVRYRFRYETRYQDDPFVQSRLFGHLFMADVRYKPTKTLTLNGRVYFFDSPAASLSTGVEEIWAKTIYFRFAGSMNNLRGEPGQRVYLTANQRLGRDVDLWFKFDINHRPGDLTTIQSTVAGQQDKAFSSTRVGFHTQLDYKWGGSANRLPADQEYRRSSGKLGEEE